MKSLAITLLVLASSCGGGQASSSSVDLAPLPPISNTPIAQLIAANEPIGLNSAQITSLREIDVELIAANAPLEEELAGFENDPEPGPRSAELRAAIEHNNRAALHRAFGLFDLPQRGRAIDQLRDQGHDVEAIFPDRSASSPR